ncbi:MAG TPA: ATP-grasp domain-containing protein [Streptosporangiaceae bacterium]|nr:ATP-grasp domain-containing protein [Streptosporangiaceae bacterium]
MRVLLSDGSGLTARQSATTLSEAGHVVEALSPDPLCLCKFTSHVRRVHRVPCYGLDPFSWLDAALTIYARGRFDVLLPTQEQVAVLSASAARLREVGVVTAVPPFDALAQVQDKLSAFATLTRLRIPQPSASVIVTPEALAAWEEFPIFLKAPIGTATSGVHLIAAAGDLDKLGPSWADAFAAGGLLAQAPVEGQLVMVQSIFANGELLAFHACTRVREGARGGASHKRSVVLPAVRQHMDRLGKELGWHGALSADVILGQDGPVFIDINPRLVEPVNALRSGVDLVGSLLDVARSAAQKPQPSASAGINTHQLLLAVLGAAQHDGKRGNILGELRTACLHRGAYRNSKEELTPPRHDPRACGLVALAATATVIRPRAWKWFASGSVAAYALTPAGWSQIVDRARRLRVCRSR